MNTNIAAIRIAKNRMHGVAEDRELAGGHRVDRAVRELDAAGQDGRRRGTDEEQRDEDDPADELEVRLQVVEPLRRRRRPQPQGDDEPQERDARRTGSRYSPTATGRTRRRRRVVGDRSPRRSRAGRDVDAGARTTTVKRTLNTMPTTGRQHRGLAQRPATLLGLVSIGPSSVMSPSGSVGGVVGDRVVGHGVGPGGVVAAAERRPPRARPRRMGRPWPRRHPPCRARRGPARRRERRPAHAAAGQLLARPRRASSPRSGRHRARSRGRGSTVWMPSAAAAAADRVADPVGVGEEQAALRSQDGDAGRDRVLRVALDVANWSVVPGRQPERRDVRPRRPVHEQHDRHDDPDEQTGQRVEDEDPERSPPSAAMKSGRAANP